jgi:hypothetical protein
MESRHLRVSGDCRSCDCAGFANAPYARFLLSVVATDVMHAASVASRYLSSGGVPAGLDSATERAGEIVALIEAAFPGCRVAWRSARGEGESAT